MESRHNGPQLSSRHDDDDDGRGRGCPLHGVSSRSRAMGLRPSVADCSRAIPPQCVG